MRSRKAMMRFLLAFSDTTIFHRSSLIHAVDRYERIRVFMQGFSLCCRSALLLKIFQYVFKPYFHDFQRDRFRRT